MIKKDATRAIVITHIAGFGVIPSEYYLKNNKLLKDGKVVA